MRALTSYLRQGGKIWVWHSKGAFLHDHELHRFLFSTILAKNFLKQAPLSPTTKHTKCTIQKPNLCYCILSQFFSQIYALFGAKFPGLNAWTNWQISGMTINRAVKKDLLLEVTLWLGLFIWGSRSPPENYDMENKYSQSGIFAQCSPTYKVPPS